MLADTVLRGLPAPEVQAAPVAALDFVIPDGVMMDGLSRRLPRISMQPVARLDQSRRARRRIALPELAETLDLITHRAVLAAVEALDLHWDRLHGPDAARMDARVVRRIMNAAAIQRG